MSLKKRTLDVKEPEKVISPAYFRYFCALNGKHQMTQYTKQRNPLFLLLMGSLLFFAILSSCKTGKESLKQVKPGKGEFTVMDPNTRRLHEMFLEANKEKILGNPDKAIEIYNMCLGLDPKNAATMYELAQIYDSQGKIQDALSMSKKAAELDPSNSWFLFLYAQLLESAQNYKEAGNVYKRLSALEPNNPEFIQDLAQVYINQSRFSDALKAYDDLEKRYGPDEAVTLQKQKIYLAMGKLDKAIEQVQNLIKMNPLETRYYSILAETYMANNMPDQALETYNKILAMDPNNPYIHIALADFYRKKGNKELFTQELKLGFANVNLDIDTKIQILLTFFSLSEVVPEMKDQAYDLIHELIVAHPKDPKAYSIYGDFLYRDQKLTEARDAFRQVIVLDSSRYAVWEQLLRIEAEKEDYAALASESRRAVELFPEQPGAFLFRGIALYQLKDYKQTIETLKQGVSMVVDNNELEETFYSMLGDSYNQEKEYTKSDEAYQISLQIKPDNAYVLNNYSYFLSLRGENLEKADSMAKKANELVPDNSSYLDTYAWVLYKMNRLTDAEQWMLKALAHEGDKSAVILEHYGDILFKKGDTEKAAEYWKKAKDAGKGSDLLEKKLNEKKLYE